MESNPLRGLFGVSSPQPEEQRIAPQPTEHYRGDGTLHPDMHLIYVDEVCGLFKLAGMREDVMKKKVFPLSLKGKALTWFRLCDDIGSRNYN